MKKQILLFGFLGSVAIGFGQITVPGNGHLIYNPSTSGVIDWGNGGANDDLYFRSLSTLGNINTYTDRVRIKYNGWTTFWGDPSNNNASNPSDQIHVFPSATATGITVTNSSATNRSAITLENTSSPRKYSLGTTGFSDPSGASKFAIRDLNANADRFVITSAGSVGIGTVSPTYFLDVRGNSTFGAGLTQTDFAWTPTSDQRGMILTGVPGLGNGFGSYIAGNSATPYSGQILGAYMFGQTVPSGSPANAGVKAAIISYATGNGSSTIGYGGEMSFTTSDDISSTPTPTVERMKINSIGNVGVGNYRTNTALFPFPNPYRRFEVLSDKTAVTGLGNPQLRLTHRQQDPANQTATGGYTDFHTTNTGDLAINTRSNTNTPNATRNLRERFVGINTNTPGNTLEINSQYALWTTANGQPAAPSFAAPTGWAGLRFTDLRSTSIPQANPGNGVLSVNANGDVIYVPSASTANNGLSVNGNTIQLGATCNSATVGLGALTNTRAIPLAGNHFIFSEIVGGAGRVGIGKNINCAPGNQLEVNNGIPGNTSGLRLTDLAGQAGGAPNGKVLSVNPSGDVILTTAPVGNNFGGNCGTTPPALSNSWEIPLGGFNYVFSGANTNTTVSNVGIGTTCLPQAKLHVNQSSGSTAGSTGLLVENNDVGPCLGTSTVIALKSIVNTPSNITGDKYRIAGWFESPNPNNCGLVNNFALYVPQGGGNVSIGYPTPTAGALLDVNGNVNINGSGFISGGPWTSSDNRFKKDIKKLENVNDKIKKLSGYTYNFKIDEFKKKNFEGNEQIGLIAQELKEVFPQLVKEDAEGYLTVNYQGMVPVLLSAIKEQQTQIEAQQKQIDELKNMVQSLANNSDGTKNNNSTAVNLSDKSVLVLNQNVPNPFAESTVITYNIPSDFSKAQLIFSTSDGKVIKAVDVTTKGEGRLNVFANDLSSGLYSYTLIIDGKTVDTKKMVKQ